MAPIKIEISSDQLPKAPSITSTIAHEEHLMVADAGLCGSLEETEKGKALLERVEEILLRRIADGHFIALFQLGQLYFEEGEYAKALPYFEQAEQMGDMQATFQLGVIHYDGLLGDSDYAKGFDYMMQVATSTSPHARHLLRAAQHNIGRAYYEGRGVSRSDADAEKYWLLAADDGNPNASVHAQATLGLFYSQPNTPTQDLNKAAFWHSEACGNGSLESQGALGVMYLTGMSGKKDDASAFICLRDAANRGSVFAMGHLTAYYYRHKLFTKAIETATK